MPLVAAPRVGEAPQAHDAPRVDDAPEIDHAPEIDDAPPAAEAPLTGGVPLAGAVPPAGEAPPTGAAPTTPPGSPRASRPTRQLPVVERLSEAPPSGGAEPTGGRAQPATALVAPVPLANRPSGDERPMDLAIGRPGAGISAQEVVQRLPVIERPTHALLTGDQAPVTDHTVPADGIPPTADGPQAVGAPHPAEVPQSVDAPLTLDPPLRLDAARALAAQPAPTTHHDRTPGSGLPVVARLDRAGMDQAPLTGDAAPLSRPDGGPGGSLRVGRVVSSWPPAGGDVPLQRAPATFPGDTGPAGVSAPADDGLPVAQTLVPLHRMFSGGQDDGAPGGAESAVPTVHPGVPSLPPIEPVHRPRWGVGAPTVQRTAYPDGDATGRAGTPAGPALTVGMPVVAGSGAPPAFTDMPQAPGPTSPSGTSGFTEVLLQRAAADQDGAPVQTIPPPAPSPAPPADVDPAAADQAASAAPADPVALLPTGRALDELVERLYEPLTARLRTELWLDRERSGLMVNLRR